MSAAAAAAAAKGREAAAEGEKQAAEARERIGSLERCDDVPGGLRKPRDFEKELLDAGFTKAQLRHMRDLNEAADAFGFEAVFKCVMTAKDRAERRVVTQMAQLWRAWRDAQGA